MGVEVDHFVDGERISTEFLCPICQGVVEPAVVTPCDHLFCEGCLLSWLQRREKGKESCPVCVELIDAERVKRPSRIILNLLGELERFCCHREEGCDWTGTQEAFPHHVQGCRHVPRTALVAKIERRDARIAQLSTKLTKREAELARTQERLEIMALENHALRQQLRVFEDLLVTDSEQAAQPSNDVQRIRKLREAQHRLEAATDSAEHARFGGSGGSAGKRLGGHADEGAPKHDRDVDEEEWRSGNADPGWLDRPHAERKGDLAF